MKNGRFGRLMGWLVAIALIAAFSALGEAQRSPSPSGLPPQHGQSGNYLTTDGHRATWGSIPASIPSQTGHNGDFLTTNGTSASWTTTYYPYSLKRYVDTFGKNLVTLPGNQRSGSMFAVTLPWTLKGCRFYWGTSAKIISIKAYAVGNSVALGQVNVTTNSFGGWYDAIFSSPIAATAYTPYSCSIWDTTAGSYQIFNMQGSVGGVVTDLWDGGQLTHGLLTGPYFIWMNWGFWNVGDNAPNQTATSERYPVEPIFTIP